MKNIDIRYLKEIYEEETGNEITFQDFADTIEDFIEDAIREGDLK